MNNIIRVLQFVMAYFPIIGLTYFFMLCLTSLIKIAFFAPLSKNDLFSVLVISLCLTIFIFVAAFIIIKYVNDEFDKHGDDENYI